jgi:oxygen-dependent protoporphyrinogen oxidase
MQVIADRLVQRLAGPGTSTRFLPIEVTGLRSDGGGVIVSPGDERYDGAVVAAPGPAALGLLGPLLGGSARAQAELDGARFASVGIITLGFDAGAVAVPAGYSGLLVAPGSDLLVTACSFGSNKWPHWSGPGTVVLRVSVGKAGDERWAALSDDDLVSRVLDELATILGTPGAKGPAPRAGAWRVSRWPRSLPPYPVGHLQDMAALRSELRSQAPTVALAGASYGRVGVPACIASGRQAGALVTGSPAPSPAK